jgi:selenocysteine-specific translation elongation factor
MGNLVVAVLGALGYGNGLGKKSTSTDITLYDLKRDRDIVTFIEPTRYPDRLAPLFYATSIAKRAIVIVDELNSNFGECLVMLQCSGLTAGYIILRKDLIMEMIQPLIKGTILERFEFVEDNPIALKERLIKEASKQDTATVNYETHSSGTVPVDHAFNVKGVGTVILGVVKEGIIKKHEQLNVLPGKKIASIRSIQEHDDEFNQAFEGDRVGLALKNVEGGDLDRGTVLTNNSAIKSTTSLKARASIIKYWPTPIKSGMILHIGHWMQFIPSRVESITDEGDWHKPILTLTLEKELIHFPSDQAVITYLDGGKLRVAGTLELP